jgi:hypothetical protein
MGPSFRRGVRDSGGGTRYSGADGTEDGKVDLMAPVSKYLPEFKDLKVGVEAVEPGTGKPALTLEPQHREMTYAALTGGEEAGR